MAKWIGNNKAYKRVIKKVELPKSEVPKTEIPKEKSEEMPINDIEALLKKAKEKANGSL